MSGYEYKDNRLYRARDGEIFGVCQGVADWRDLPVSSVRLITIVIALFSGFIPIVIVYFLLGIILPMEPEGRHERDSRNRSNRGRRERSSRRDRSEGYSVNDIKDEFDRLKEKVSLMEDDAIDKEKEWEDRLKNGDK